MATQPDSRWVKHYTERLQQLFSGIEPGLAIVFGSSDAEGAELDTTNMITAFGKASGLGFAVFNAGLDNITREELLALIHAAANFTPITGKVEAIALYFAGHGGSHHNQPYIGLAGKDSIYIDELLSPFTRENKAKRIFFFDVCCRADDTESVFYLPSKVNSIVAIATDTRSAGDYREGGYWTRHLWRNITKDMDIFSMLALTRKETIECTVDMLGRYHSGDIQEPCFTACMGHFNLKSLQKDHQQTRQHDNAGPSKSCAIEQSKRIETDGDSNIGFLMKKQPVLRDLLNWLRKIASDWNKLGKQLKVEDGSLKSFSRDRGLDDQDRLSEVFDVWKSSMCSPYTFENLLSCLEDMGKIACVREIKEKLQDPEVQERYRNTPDFKY